MSRVEGNDGVDIEPLAKLVDRDFSYITKNSLSSVKSSDFIKITVRLTSMFWENSKAGASALKLVQREITRKSSAVLYYLYQPNL